LNQAMDPAIGAYLIEQGSTAARHWVWDAVHSIGRCGPWPIRSPYASHVVVGRLTPLETQPHPTFSHAGRWLHAWRSSSVLGSGGSPQPMVL